MKTRLCAIAAAYLLTGFATAQATPLLAQNGPHVSYNNLPFGTASTATRYEQVFSGALFVGPTLIKSLAFSSDSVGAWSGNVTIKLSSTTAAVGGLSSTLGANVTGPETTVFSQVGYSQNIASAGSESFGFVFDIADYLFSGSGNLLLDITLSNVNSALNFSRSDSGNVSSRAFDITAFSGADGVALRTLFEIGTSVVPEPDSFALLGIAALAALSTARRRKRSAP